jgi:hypothetical protein
MFAIFKMAAKTRHNKWAVKIQHCPIIFVHYILLKHVCLLPYLYLYGFVLLYFCCFVLKYQSIKELLRAHVCHVDLYILLPTLNKIYLLTYLPTYNILMISDNVEFLPPICYAVFWQPFWKWQTSRKFLKRRIAPLMVTYHYVKFDVSIFDRLIF